MKENTLEEQHKNTFDDLKHINGDGQEFWYARQLSKVLEYVEYRNFLPVIKKAMLACENSGQDIANHFVEVHEMVPLGSGAEREMMSYALSRYACYLIVQNADPSKPVIANGQTYFAMQTRRQELADDEAFKQLSEGQKRVFLRNELREHNKQLVATAQDAGVESNLDFAIFQNHGYMGLYGGLGAKEIHQKKGLKKNQKILDHMGSTELAANLFRATQTEEKLRREDIKGKEKANQTHFQVGKKVRKTIEEIGGTLPENLPTPDSSVKKLEKEIKKDLPQIEENE
jgi:DNA-damage-inducible protein D